MPIFPEKAGRFGNLPKVTRPESSETKTWTQAVKLQSEESSDITTT